MDTFEPVDPQRCAHYAKFASHLWRWQFDLIYWSLFVFNLFVLFTAAYGYTKCLVKVDTQRPNSPEQKRTITRCILFTAGCVLVSLVTVIMEVFALLALQFCDGEDLMSLYWSTWTMIQVGSLIAVCGIILALLHTLKDRKHPPWALALGTPVLVVAGLFSFLQSCVSKRYRQFKEEKISSKRQGKDRALEEGTLPMSQVLQTDKDYSHYRNTIAVDSDEDSQVDEDENIHGAEIIGLTLEGGPIIHFRHGVPSRLPDRAQVIGRCEDNKPIVVCRQDGFQFVYEGVEASKASSCSKEKAKTKSNTNNNKTTTKKQKNRGAQG